MDVLQNKALSKNAPWPHRDFYRYFWKIKMVSICQLTIYAGEECKAVH